VARRHAAPGDRLAYTPKIGGFRRPGYPFVTGARPRGGHAAIDMDQGHGDAHMVVVALALTGSGGLSRMQYKVSGEVGLAINHGPIGRRIDHRRRTLRPLRPTPNTGAW